MGEDGVMRRPWCAATRLLEHREMESLNSKAEAAKAAAQAQMCGGTTGKHKFREDFPPLEEVGASLSSEF